MNNAGTHPIFTELQVPGMTDDDFQRAFVLSRPRAKWLADKLRCMLVHTGRGRASMDPDKQVCMFLHACAKAHVYRDVGERFAVSVATVKRVLARVCNAINTQFRHVVQFPRHEDLQDIAGKECRACVHSRRWLTSAAPLADSFASYCGIPGIIGAIDSSHIPCVPSDAFKVPYLDRTKRTTFHLLANVTSDMQFRGVDIGAPGGGQPTRTMATCPDFDCRPQDHSTTRACSGGPSSFVSLPRCPTSTTVSVTMRSR